MPESLNLIKVFKMIGKLLNLCLHLSAPGTTNGLRHHGTSGIEAFYAGLSEGLKNLYESLGPADSDPNFSLEWLCLVVDFLCSIHSKVLMLIEDVWLPTRITAGVDVLNLYLEVSMRILDLCNCLKDRMGQLESYQMSLEHALSSLASAVKSISVHDDSRVSTSLQACKDELEMTTSKNRTPALWADFASKLDQGGVGASRSGGSGKTEMSLRRSRSFLPATSPDRKTFDISLVMADVQVVSIFISCLLLWVLSDSFEEFKSAVKLDGHGTANGVTGWSASLLRLGERVENAQLKRNTGEILHRVNCLQEFENVRNSIFALHEKIEAGWKQGGTAASSGNEWLEESRTMLEQTRDKAAEILESSERLAVRTSEAFAEIIHSRKKLLDTVENQLIRSLTL